MDERPDLSIVIPSHNEIGRLPGTIRAVLAYIDERHPDAQLVLVDDASTDGTAEIIGRAARGDGRIVPVILSEHRGKGGAVGAGVGRSTGERVAFVDADLGFDLGIIDRAAACIDAGADLAIGSRARGPHPRRGMSFTRRIASWTFNALVEAALGLGIDDTQCPLKMFRRGAALDLFDSMTIGGFAFDVEILLIARRRGLRIDVVAVDIPTGSGSSVRLGRDGPRMVRDVGRIWFRARFGGYPAGPRRP